MSGEVPNGGLHSHPPLGTLLGMDTTPWRERVRLEEELLQQLEVQMSQAAKRRAAALKEGVAELGSVYKVAKELHRSWTAVDTAIKRHGPKAS